MIEPIDQQYFKIMLAENYNEEEYSNLDEMFTKASKIATNDELFYLALSGSIFVRVHSITILVERNDKRIIYTDIILNYHYLINKKWGAL